MSPPNCYRPTAKMKYFAVVLVFTFFHITAGLNIENGGIIDEDTYVDIYGSPYLVSRDTIVAKDVTLTIQEGVEMRFAPRVMLAVNGTLIAKGTEQDHIVFTKDPGLGGDHPEWPKDIRLVDDRSVAYGRLQLLYNGKWRGVCANYQNWTEEDTKVACQQLGFEWGNFSFISWARNDSLNMLYHRPDCTGEETHLMDCPRANTIEIGTNICEQQKTVHLHCYGLAKNSPSAYNWWGLELYNASTKNVYEPDRNIVIQESASVLEWVDITHAGLDKNSEPVPALRASPWAPHLVHVTILHSALDATNFTDIKGSTLLRDGMIRNNRGHGLVVESHMGRVHVIDSDVSYNKGNGIKHKSLDGHFPVLDSDNSFCRRNIIGGVQTFPQFILGIPDWETSGPCELRFQTYQHEKVTLNFLEMDIEQDPGRINEGMLSIYDGSDSISGTLMAEYEIMNGTLPQSLTSWTHQMVVKFSWTKAVHCDILSYCIKFTILVDAGPTVVPELYVSNSIIHNNTQHGMYVENVRNYAFVNESYVSYNEYGAGLRVYGGAGDVHVNASTFMYNHDNAINVTHEGGMRIFNESTFSHNLGNGINVTLNETTVNNKTRYSRHQKTEVFRSEFVMNDGLGVRVSNSCSAGLVVVNESSFIQNHGDGIDYESCFKIIPDQNMTNFTVGYNHFQNNYGHAIKASPLLNTYGRIGNNTFEDHERHVLLIDNTEDFLMNRLYTLLKVDYTVSGNEFTNNHGFYVANLRMTQGSNLQMLRVYQNTFSNNVIEGRMSTLNERSRAHAVVIVSSSNVNFTCNVITNPGSEFELATHLDYKSVELDLPRQWWGTLDYEEIAFRVFEQESRYNLAKIDYFPAMKNHYVEECGQWDHDEDKPVEIEFDRGDTIGGKLGRKFVTEPNKKYWVDRDINVLPNGEFVVSEGTRLEFENAIGMLIQGKFDARGKQDEKIVFTLKNETTMTNHSHARLVAGPNEMEGRLEIRPTEDDEWGTVCDLGWDIMDAAVACQMFGLVVHPDDWKVYENTPGPDEMPIWRSNLGCTDLDIDITKCAADGINDHSCNHTSDVNLRCHNPTWGGTRFLATAQKGHLSHATIDQAGLLDPAAIVYAPALQIDYNVHALDNLLVTNNMATGIEILHNDVYADAKLDRSTVSYNLGNGIATRGSFFTVQFSTLNNNVLAGFEYNPALTTYELQQLRAGINSPYYVEDMDGQTLRIVEDDYEFLCTREGSSAETHTYEVEITVDTNYFVIMDYLDYNPDTTQEEVTIFDSRRSNIGEFTHRWVIEDDLVDFPIVSSGSYLTLRWKVHGVSSGRLTFATRSRHHSWRWPFAEIRVHNTTTTQNDNGIITRHYNQPSNEWLDLFWRFRWEEVEMFGVDFRSNFREAMHVPSITKYHELYMPTLEELQTPSKIAEITYQIEACHFIDNGGGVAAEHNHIEFSNNVWIWEVTHNHFEKNRAGGYTIELPKVNLMYQELYNHSVDINDTIFENNELFEFRIDGFYCNSSIARNTFTYNNCKKDCIVISGTEKDFDMHDNEITHNTGQSIVDFHMTSHTPYTRWVDATVTYNNLKQNKMPPALADDDTGSSPDTYTFGVRGVQNITINRNLFSNSLHYELIGGQDSSLLENYLDVTENWWGSYDQVYIQEAIFDFDDWNNFAIAEYYPYLIADHYESEVATGGKLEPELDPTEPIGGRIESNLILTKEHSPYTVKADLTVMPGYSLVIDPGVELQFMPHVGILVLGSMTAIGYEDDRVRFNPVMKTNTRKKRGIETDRFRLRSTVFESADEVRLSGGEHPDEGFIEIYNSTERRWTIMCDESFNDRTAEVACKTMEKEHSNVIVRRNRYYDHFVLGYPKMHEQVIEWFWRRTFICDGSEENLDQCQYKTNYNLYTCMEARDYIFVRCGERNLAEEYDYWGNVRFSTPEYEHGNIAPGYSILEYVDIFGAGILHDEKSAAVVAVHRKLSTEYVRITNCASNGYDYVAPRDEFEVAFNDIENNNGYAVGGLILNGESQYEDPLSSFVPLVESTIPYNLYGLVRMCTTEKLIYVENRMLLYYKYRFDTIDCIKIIRSREPKRQIALRFLQLNLYNDSFYENAVEMYNYEYFEPEHLIGEITPNSTETDKRLMYETSYEVDTMGIRVTASAAHGDYGFIAEVVVTPYTIDWRPDLGPGHKQRIANNDLSGNQDGAFKFQNAGELNPSVIVEQNRIQDGGVKILNMTGPHVVDMFIQNSRLLTISNNYIAYNYGGLLVNATTNSITTAVYANITNNVIMHNTHGSILHMEGHHYQGFDIRYNYIAHNDIEYRNVLGMFGINLNFTSNHIYYNTGETILNCSVPEKVSISQRFVQNAFYDNFAFGANKTTTFLRTAKHQFTNNYLVNRRNIYEMVTYNRTKYDDIGGVYPDVDAADNWWGNGNPSFISGRIWDRRDDDNLINVNYEPFHETNETLMQGKCHPGWRLYENQCYLYMGGVVTYEQGDQICRSDGKVLALAYDRNVERFLGEVVLSKQANYDQYWRVWVNHDYQKDGKCSVLRDYGIEHFDCNALLPFICEHDPYVEPGMSDGVRIAIIVSVSVVAGILLIILVLACFAWLKSHTRKEQRQERKNSLRASLRGSKASLYTNRTQMSAASVNDLTSHSKRRRPPMSTSKMDSGMVDISGVTLEATSTDSIDKMKMDSHRPSTPASVLDYSSYTHSRVPDNSSYYDSDLGPVKDTRYLPPLRLENEISNIPARPAYPSYGNPAYGNVPRNEMYDDQSLDRSLQQVDTKSMSSLNSPRGYNQQFTYLPPTEYRGPRTAAPSGYPSSSAHPGSSYPSYRNGNGHNSTLNSSTLSASSGAINRKPPRPKPKETAM